MKQKYVYKIDRNADVIEIKVWDQSRRSVFKRKCNVYDKAALADILFSLKAFGIDFSKLTRTYKEEIEEEKKWFKDF